MRVITARLLSFTCSIRFRIYMDGIIMKSESCGGVKNGDCTEQHLFFADDFAPLKSIQNSLRKALIRFSDACSVVGMKINSLPVQQKQKPCACPGN